MAKDEHNQERHTPAMGARDLAENGREDYGWRIVDGASQLVVVGIGFTIAGQEGEDFEAFKARMLCLARLLGTELGYAVISLRFQRRTAQRKRHWAEFDCETPEYRLPRVLSVELGTS